MAMSRTLKGLLAGCLLAVVQQAAHAQAPTVDTMLEKRFDPKQKDVAITTLTKDEAAACTVRAIAGTRPGSTGWELLTGKGKIDSWVLISAEEVGYEGFQAVATGDFPRLQALFITEAEMNAIKLP